MDSIADGMEQMCLTESDMSVEEEWIIDLTRSLCDCSSGIEGEVDMSSADDRIECKLRIELVTEPGALESRCLGIVEDGIETILFSNSRSLDRSCYFEDLLKIDVEWMGYFILERDEDMEIVAILLIVDTMDSFFESFLKEFFRLTEDKLVGDSDVEFLMFFVDTDDSTFIQKWTDDLGVMMKREMFDDLRP